MFKFASRLAGALGAFFVVLAPAQAQAQGQCAAGAYQVYTTAGIRCSTALPANTSILTIAPNNSDIPLVFRQSGHGQAVIQQNYYQGTNNSSVNTTFGQQRFVMTATTAGAETGCFDWYTIQTGTYAQRMQLCETLRINGSTLKTSLAANLEVNLAQSNGVDQPSCVAPATAGSGNPCLTLQYAWQQLYSNYDAAGFRVTLRIKNGETLTKGLQMFGNIQGIEGPGNLRIIGNIHDATSATIKINLPTSGYCVSGVNGTYFSVFSLTCDGGEAAANCFDKFAIGQFAVLNIGDVIMRGTHAALSCNSTNDFSMSNGASMTILGDLYFTQGHRQVGIYGGTQTNVYLNVNGVHGSITVGNTAHVTIGSNVITFDNQFRATGSPAGCDNTSGCALVGDQIQDNQGRIPRNAYIKSITTTGANAYKEVTIKDLDGVDYNATACTCATQAVLGGMYFHLYDDGLGASHSAPTWDVSMIFMTEVAGFNLQGLEFSGRYASETPAISTPFGTGTGTRTTNQPYLIKNGTILDFGSTTLAVVNTLANRYTAVGPASLIVGIADGGSFAAAVDDTTAKQVELPKIPGGIFSGTATNNALNCSEWGGTSSTPALQTNANCRFYAAGAGVHQFYSAGGATLAAELNASSANVGANQRGIYTTNAGITTIRIFNSTDTPDVRIIANTGVGQIGTNSAHALEVYTNGVVRGTWAAAGSLTLGATALTTNASELALDKMVAGASAPGAGGGKIAVICGTNAGTAKLVAYAGTSATAFTVLDNIGAGVSGC